MNIQNVLPRDAIPSIDDPAFGAEYFGDSDDEMLVVDGDPPKAYPLRVLSYHEIVNDDLDGRPVAVTWCPICWSGVVYERSVDGQELTFGVSGKLADDALVMYDRETGTEWQQTGGVAVDGPLSDRQLKALSSSMTTWAAFRERTPDGLVLQPPDGDGTPPAVRYDMERYEAYVEGDEFGLYGMRGTGEPRTWEREDVDAKTIVLGVEHDGDAVGYAVPTVEAAGGVVTDTVGGRDVVVVASETGIQAFEHPGYEFEYGDGPLRADGTTWDPVTGESADGRSLEPVPARRLFAFAWQDLHGPASFYGLSGE